MSTDLISTVKNPILRCATAGSVDDGKSTLIGRLLLDCKALMRDQLEHVEEVSLRRGFARTDLALLTDGLRAEREQGITIDVAWRYFATPARRFVLADSPGHVQYTRNMITAASQAELAIVLVDAERGPTDQTRRHLAISGLLRVPEVVVAVNKMDRVGFSEGAFSARKAELTSFATALGWKTPPTFIPVAALSGDNVVTQSTAMPWYGGPSLLNYMENAGVASTLAQHGVFSAQWVIRPQSELHAHYRGIAGRIEDGVLRVGDSVAILPSGERTTIARIERAGRDIEQAYAGHSVILHFAEDVDVSRGDVVTRTDSALPLVSACTAHLCWLHKMPLTAGRTFAIKHLARHTKSSVNSVDSALDVVSGTEAAKATLVQNDVGIVQLSFAEPLPLARYEDSRALGSFILVDSTTQETVAAGMVRDLA